MNHPTMRVLVWALIRRVTVPLDPGATSATMERLMQDDADLPFCELPRVNPAYKVPGQARPAPVTVPDCKPADDCLQEPEAQGRFVPGE